MKKKGSKKRSSAKATDKSKEGGTTGKADGTKEDGATKATYTPKPADGDAANTPIIAEVSLYIFFLCHICIVQSSNKDFFYIQGVH